MLKQYTEWWCQTPLAIRRFLLNGLFLLFVWKIVYVLFLGPSGMLDKPLTATVGMHTRSLLNYFSSGEKYTFSIDRSVIAGEPDQLGEPVNAVIRRGTQQVLTIANACNGLELFVLYIGFLLCMPAPLSRFWVFLFGGVVCIHFLNVLRCAGLAWVSSYKPGMLNFAHHYLFKIILYGIIFILWLLYTKQTSFRFVYKHKK